MEAKEARSNGMQLDEDFDQILQIDLKGFKREQLKVRTKRGILTIFGEKSSSASNYKLERFRKEFKLSKDCDVTEIRAKLFGDVLKKPESLEKQTGKKNKNSIWGVKIRKETAIKIAMVVVILVVITSIGNQIAQLVNRHPRDNKDDTKIISNSHAIC